MVKANVLLIFQIVGCGVTVGRVYVRELATPAAGRANRKIIDPTICMLI